MRKHLNLLTIILASSLLVGCATWDKFVIAIGKIDEGVEVVTDTPSTTTTTTIPPQVVSGSDAIPWDSIIIEGGNHGQVIKNAKITKVLRGVEINGNLVRLDYDTISDWAPMTHDEGGGDVWQSYGRLCAFVDFGGEFRGNHFDWLVKDAKVKDMKNIYDGYLFPNPPARGGRLWFVIVSNDGKQRTNVAEGKYK